MKLRKRGGRKPAGLITITLRNGTVVNAELLRAQADKLLVQTPGGLVIAVPDLQIASISDLPGAFGRTDPNNMRLLLAPTGRGLSAG